MHSYGPEVSGRSEGISKRCQWHRASYCRQLESEADVSEQYSFKSVLFIQSEWIGYVCSSVQRLVVVDSISYHPGLRFSNLRNFWKPLSGLSMKVLLLLCLKDSKYLLGI